MQFKNFMLATVLVMGMSMMPVAQAVMYEDVDVPDSITLSNQSIDLNGVGLREKFWVNVYIGALYLPQPASTVDAAIAQQGPKRIAMYFVHDASREAIVEAWNAGFADNNSQAAMEEIAQRIENFNGWFGDITAGDVVLMDYLPGKGTQVTINDKVKGVIDGRDFYAALMRIWLGPNPPGQDLKNGLLGLD